MLNMVDIYKTKLDKIDLKILSELDKNCRIPSTKLAKKLNKSRQTIDYRIEKLTKEGIIIGFKSSINPHKIGYKLYKIYLKLKNIPKKKEELFHYLKTSPKIYWIGECSGNWDLIFGMFCKNDYDFFEAKNELISKFNKIIIEEEGQILIDVNQYPKMYFLNKTEKPVMFAGEISNSELDKIDFAILRMLSKEARTSLVDLATETKSTIQTIQSRLKKLEEKGIIIQHRISVDLNKLGLELYKSIIKIEKYNKEDEKRFLDYVSKIQNIQYFIRNMWQLELELVVENYQEYYNIIENLKKEFADVIKTVDTVLMITDDWTLGFENLLK